MSIIQGCPSEKIDTTAGCGCNAYKINSYFITVIKGTSLVSGLNHLGSFYIRFRTKISGVDLVSAQR